MFQPTYSDKIAVITRTARAVGVLVPAFVAMDCGPVGAGRYLFRFTLQTEADPATGLGPDDLNGNQPVDVVHRDAANAADLESIGFSVDSSNPTPANWVTRDFLFDLGAGERVILRMPPAVVYGPVNGIYHFQCERFELI